MTREIGPGSARLAALICFLARVAVAAHGNGRLPSMPSRDLKQSLPCTSTCAEDRCGQGSPDYSEDRDVTCFIQASDGQRKCHVSGSWCMLTDHPRDFAANDSAKTQVSHQGPGYNQRTALGLALKQGPIQKRSTYLDRAHARADVGWSRRGMGSGERFGNGTIEFLFRRLARAKEHHVIRGSLQSWLHF